MAEVLRILAGVTVAFVSAGLVVVIIMLAVGGE